MSRLQLGLRGTLPIILQTEGAECGLACLAMVSHYHGYNIDLAALRRRYSISLRGTGFAALIDIAHRLGLASRPLRLEMQDLGNLKRPCILHWTFDHFVVLKAVSSRSITIHDPARGERKIRLRKVSDSFTGVALELWPSADFECLDERQPVRLRELLGRVSGIYGSMGKILALALALEVFTLTSPLYIQWVIDHVLASPSRDLLLTLALGFGLLVIAQQCIGALRSWLVMHVGTSLSVQWQSNVFTHLLRLPLGYFEKRHIGDIVSRFRSIDNIQKVLTLAFVEAIADGLMATVLVVVLYLYSPVLSWVCVGAMTLYGLMRWLLYRPLRTATEEHIVHSATQESHFLETVKGVKTIKLFQRQQERRNTWLALLVQQINALLRVQKLQLVLRSSNGLLFGIENIVVVYLGATLVLNGQYTVGMLMAFMAYKGQFSMRISTLIDKLSELRMLQLQGERLADIIRSEPEDESGEGRLVLSVRDEAATTVEIRDLRFRYGEHEAYVLDRLNLSVAAGESVAITGPSGCGKSTLVHILLGVLAPTEGEVLIAGQYLEPNSHAASRRMIGSLTQDDTLFAGSISENISFFDTQADQEWVEQCAHAAFIHKEIVAMPMAYNTFVGYLGTALSGGQRQRVLLARALYRRPKILILDEATNNLDGDCERAISSALNDSNFTRIIVSHRPQTIAAADYTYTLMGGRLTDQSSSALESRLHRELLATVGC